MKKSNVNKEEPDNKYVTKTRLDYKNAFRLAVISEADGSELGMKPQCIPVSTSYKYQPVLK
jgi:hypothetical protein